MVVPIKVGEWIQHLLLLPQDLPRTRSLGLLFLRVDSLFPFTPRHASLQVPSLICQVGVSWCITLPFKCWGDAQ